MPSLITAFWMRSQKIILADYDVTAAAWSGRIQVWIPIWRDSIRIRMCLQLYNVEIFTLHTNRARSPSLNGYCTHYQDRVPSYGALTLTEPRPIPRQRLRQIPRTSTQNPMGVCVVICLCTVWTHPYNPMQAIFFISLGLGSVSVNTPLDGDPSPFLCMWMSHYWARIHSYSTGVDSKLNELVAHWTLNCISLSFALLWMKPGVGVGLTWRLLVSLRVPGSADDSWMTSLLCNSRLHMLNKSTYSENTDITWFFKVLIYTEHQGAAQCPSNTNVLTVGFYEMVTITCWR